MEPQTLSPNRTNCNSPEFEFWMLRNPSFPQPNLHSADELFVDGVLLPLHLLPTTNKSDTSNQTLNVDPPIHEPDPTPSPSIIESASTFTSSKRWKDIFRKSDKKNAESNNTEEREKDKGKKKEKKSGNGSGTSSAELNINIWPFSRSRSAGNACTRPKLFAGAPANRKVNSAPCSRSNSAGESKSKKWPSSPGRPGVHVGRSSPVWQVRRSKNNDPPQKTKPRRSKVAAAASGGGGSARVLNLNVPMCIGYRHHLSCRSDENSTVGASGGGGVHGNNTNTNSNSNNCGGNDGGSRGNIFNLRNLFAKKCLVTSH